MTSAHSSTALAEALPNDLRRLVPLLPPPERLVMTLRLGLDGRGPRSVHDLARILSWRESDVRLAEQQALARLRHPVFAAAASRAAC